MTTAPRARINSRARPPLTAPECQQRWVSHSEEERTRRQKQTIRTTRNQTLKTEEKEKEKEPDLSNEVNQNASPSKENNALWFCIVKFSVSREIQREANHTQTHPTTHVVNTPSKAIGITIHVVRSFRSIRHITYATPEIS
jgi:hypothetical protein